MTQSNNLKQFLRVLTVEPFLFFIFLAFLAKQSTYTQFFQDKSCRVTYGLSSELCSFVTSSKEDEHQDLKTAILKDANQMGSYQSIIRTAPGILFTIVLAPWADKVKGARRKLMLLSAVGQIGDSVFGIISVIYEDTLPPWTALIIGVPSSLMGGMLAIQISTMGYASMTTPLAHVSLRFLIFEIVKSLCRPVSTFMSGQLLDTSSWMPNKVRNFTALYAVTMGAGLMAMVWSLLFIDDSDWKDGDRNKAEGFRFFSKENILQLKVTLTKARQNLGHIQLWVLIAINGLTNSVMLAAPGVTLSFVQEVYGWNITEFSNVSSMLFVFTFVAFALGSPFLTSMFKLTDSQLGIFGLTGGCLFMVTLGSVLNSWGFYVATLLGTFAAVGGSAVKSSVSKLVEPLEKSSSFAVMSIFQNIFTLAATWYFQLVFNRTIIGMPGLCFQIAAIFFLVAMVGFLWIDFHKSKTLVDRKNVVERKHVISIITKL
ncbi:hypothetical protein HDE_04007 [Halotydeus destructor]|nr:hypothetical protein HDE_04007 [Halotydeus destructor]